MSNTVKDDPLAAIRRERHRKFMEETWLPGFYEKYRPMFNPKRLAAFKLTSGVRKFFFKKCVNDEMIHSIPGLFRYRVYLRDSNMAKPTVKKEVKKTVSTPVAHQYQYQHQHGYQHGYQHEYKHGYKYDDIFDTNRIPSSKSHDDFSNIMEQSYNDYVKSDEDAMSKALEESMKNATYDDDILDVMEESMTSIPNEFGQEYDDFLIDEAIISSLCETTEEKKPVSNKPVSNKPVNNNEFGFWFCLDLRVYGNNLEQPIYNNGIEYYLNVEQMNKIKKVWSAIDPNTRQGEIYGQNLDYQKSQAKNMTISM